MNIRSRSNGIYKTDKYPPGSNYIINIMSLDMTVVEKWTLKSKKIAKSLNHKI